MSGISILMYHQVGPFERPDKHRASYCHVDRFRAQMRMLATVGVPVISLDDAAAMLRGDKALKRSVVLTFDDGCRNFREHALPILERHEFPATVYAIAGMAGGRADWLAAAGHAAAPLMTWSELRDIQSRGVCIGSHSLNHVKLGDLTVDEQRRQMVESRKILQDELGHAVPHMCYPYGSHTLDTITIAAEAGYETGVTCQRGAATPHDDPMSLPRKAISYGDTFAGVWWKVFMKDAPKGEAIRRT